MRVLTKEETVNEYIYPDTTFTKLLEKKERYGDHEVVLVREEYVNRYQLYVAMSYFYEGSIWEHRV